jgi:hypothetical protein
MTVLWSMRALAATGICVALAALAGGAQARDVSMYRGPCGEVVLPSGPTGLSSAIRIDTRCGSFAVGPHGVRFAGPRKRGSGYVGLVGGRRGWLNFYERGRVRWRSRLRHQWGAGVSDSRSLAFLSSRGRLYITDLRRPERAVGARFENPLGWTREGLLVTAQKHVLRARTRSGRLVRILESRAGSRTFDQRSRTLVYVARGGALVRTDGRSTQKLALRVHRWVEIRPLEEERIALVGRRVVVLGSDGSVMASDRRHYNVPAISSHGMIAMVWTGRLDGHSRAEESVRLLRPGRRSSTPLFVNKVSALGCGHWPTLAWRGDDLLYATTEGRVVVIDPGSGEHLDLSAVVRRLPGEFLEARWS